MEDFKKTTMINILKQQVDFWENTLIESQEDEDLKLHSYYCKGCLEQTKRLLETFLSVMK